MGQVLLTHYGILIPLVFLLLRLKHNCHKTSMKLFALFLFLMHFFGNVKINPDPTRTFKVSLSICHWNLNCLSAHNYVKLSLIRAYLVFYKVDIICLSDDDTLKIPGYNLLRSEHPFNSKRGGVCIYYKNYLPI